MNNYGLPVTGFGGISLGYVVLTQSWLLAIAVVLIGTGVLALRKGWRSGKSLTEA